MDPSHADRAEFAVSLPARPTDLRFDLPARPGCARLAAAGAAAALADASDPNARDDVRLVVGELVNLLAGAAAPAARLHVWLWVCPSTVVVEGRVTAATPGFEAVWISDHFHPWMDVQGQSPFVWTPIGGIAATTSLRITTAVTCPTVRIHPAIVAQAAATAGVATGGRFRLGVGTGERLNEHILGDVWPPVEIRLEMLEEAVEVMRALWDGGLVTHRGTHYRVDNAQLYTLPVEPVAVQVSAFGPKALSTAARIGDGLITMGPDADAVATYRDQGGRGPAAAGLKGCWASDAESAAQTAMDWANQALPGQLAQELSVPLHYEQATSLVTPDMMAEQYPLGPDPERWVEAIEAHVDAGFDEVYISQMGPDQAGFFTFWEDEVRPRLG